MAQSSPTTLDGEVAKHSMIMATTQTEKSDSESAHTWNSGISRDALVNTPDHVIRITIEPSRQTYNPDCL
jgi:hypothetical protein